RCLELVVVCVAFDFEGFVIAALRGHAELCLPDRDRTLRQSGERPARRVQHKRMVLTDRNRRAPVTCHAARGDLPPEGGGGLEGERAGPHHDPRGLYADFFLSSSTSVNSASTTSSCAASL